MYTALSINIHESQCCKGENLETSQKGFSWHWGTPNKALYLNVLLQPEKKTADLLLSRLQVNWTGRNFFQPEQALPGSECQLTTLCQLIKTQAEWGSCWTQQDPITGLSRLYQVTWGETPGLVVTHIHLQAAGSGQGCLQGFYLLTVVRDCEPKNNKTKKTNQKKAEKFVFPFLVWDFRSLCHYKI